MNTVLWVLQALLAAIFLAAGGFHLLMPMARLKATAPWTEDVRGPLIRVIGLLEVLAGIGLVLPGITHIATVLELRRRLQDAGHDCGPHTIAHHLRLELGTAPSIATIWRILQRHRLITPQPHKRPRSSFIRFQAAQPNELWQADSTHWQLSNGSDVEILNCLAFRAARLRGPQLSDAAKRSGISTTSSPSMRNSSKR